MIKHEIIGGLKEVDYSAIPTEKELAENLAVKIGIVKADPLEKIGERIKLNAGHTVAHAIEKATNYAISHGEAVAIGCVEEARLAVRMGLAEESWPNELAERFKKANLPTQLPEGMTFESLKPLMAGDKKREANTVVFALPCAWGDVRAVTI
jgi:3-dehydroquinate synthetase